MSKQVESIPLVHDLCGVNVDVPTVVSEEPIALVDTQHKPTPAAARRGLEHSLLWKVDQSPL